MTTLPLAQWRDFYAMIGTASGVIVGATFVVASLASGLKERALGMRGFITPTAVHLGSVLVSSALLTVPVLTPLLLAVLLGAGGAGGAIYALMVAARIWPMELDLSDRSFYVILPVLSYLALAIAALLALRDAGLAFDILAVALVVLLVTGMRNAWDMANFMITRERSE